MVKLAAAKGKDIEYIRAMMKLKFKKNMDFYSDSDSETVSISHGNQDQEEFSVGKKRHNLPISINEIRGDFNQNEIDQDGISHKKQKMDDTFHNLVISEQNRTHEKDMVQPEEHKESS